MHYVNSQDHTDLKSKYAVKQESEEITGNMNTQTKTDTQTQTQTQTNDYDIPSFDYDDNTTSSCCDDPQIQGESGDTFRLNSGSIIRLEDNESICLNCEEIHK